MEKLKLFIILTLSMILFSCKGKKVQQLENQLAIRVQQVSQLTEQVDHLQGSNASLLDRMTDLSIVNKTGAESIQQSLENIGRQYNFIEDLTQKIQAKDSLNLALVMNLKRSLGDLYDEDVEIEVKGGLVYVSISDRLLFQTGSARVTAGAKRVLGKLAKVINDHNQLNILVEGHTDDVPINTGCMADNWDLSVKRATSIVRVLQFQHYVSPERLTAAGRAEYIPKASNQTSGGRTINRRTEIIITPQLDQFFELLETKELVN